MFIFFYVCNRAGAINKCFQCRSRGELGDCGDPFASDDKTKESDGGVDVAPCSSGWCGKIVENQGDFDVKGEQNTPTNKQQTIDNFSIFSLTEYGLATQRVCLQRGPPDNVERCSKTRRNFQDVYMCFCRGDLCNGSPRGTAPSIIIISLCTVIARMLHASLRA